jgi:transcriptional regulator of nitric oxide reductase
MKKTVLAAIVGAIFVFPLHTTAQAAQTAASNAEINDCIRVIAQQERHAAKRTEGAERRTLIKALGTIKMACANGHIEQAYKDAAKLQLAPQKASAD